MSFGAAFSKLDIYKKIPKDLSEGTKAGGVISILTILVLTFLFCRETKNFIFPELKYRLRSDDPITREEMRVYIDIEFPKFPCELISLDLADELLTHQPNVETISKWRLDKYGNHLQEHSFELYDLDENKHYDIAKKAVLNQYGCRINGMFNVQEVPGNFHISSHAYAELYFKLVEDKVITALDITHKIHQLYFGSQASANYVEQNVKDVQLRRLTNSTHTAKNTSVPYLSHYHLDIVPTIYEEYTTKTKTYQYTVSHSSLSLEEENMSVVYFIYSIGGMVVDIYPDRMTFLQFMIQLCGIIGGAYMLASTFDGLMHKILKPQNDYVIIE